LFASSWYIFLTYIYDARSHLYQTTNDIDYINYIIVELLVSAYIEAIFRFSMQAKRYGDGGPDAEIS